MQVLAELIRAPERTIQASPSSQDPQTYIREMRIFHVGHNVMQNQKEAVESLIQQLPKFPLTGISSESNVCSICLDELETGTEVRGLPCAHNFHVDCIDQWLRLNVKCPHCRFSVFPQINLPENSNLGINTAVIGNNSIQGGPVFVNTSSGRIIRIPQRNLVQTHDYTYRGDPNLERQIGENTVSLELSNLGSHAQV
ncbi:hypothetical protein O6H91_Y071400 [Diphasiastrum complanatum]|nr:hypothetical protein O6H91_Y071400 [Diphasiastrum complanatum]